MQTESTASPRVDEIWASEELLALTRAGVEIWRPVVGSDGWYDVSNLGQVRSWVWGNRNGRWRTSEPNLLTPSPIGSGGYLAVTLSTGEKQKCGLVHVLMAEAFIGPRPGSYRFWQAGHHDDNKQNNRLDNIRWVTAMQNTNDRRRNGGRTKPARPCEVRDGVAYYLCTRCLEWKPKDEFGRITGKNAKASECGIQPNCRKCANYLRNECRKRTKAA